MFGSGTIDIRKYRIKRVVKFGKRRKSALTELLLFCANASDNFLERELGMKKGVGASIVAELGKGQRLRSYIKS